MTNIPSPLPDASLNRSQDNKNASPPGLDNIDNRPEPKSHPVDDLPERFRLFHIWATKDGRCTCPNGKRCTKPGKHPMFRGWQDGTLEVDVEGLKEICDPSDDWVGVECNIGLRTGVKTKPGWKLVVVEGDSEEGCAWIEAFGVSGTRTSLTRRGRHYFFLVPKNVEIKNATDIVPDVDGVDVRGEGGYIVAPGSMHVSGHVYRWGNDTTIMLMPDALLKYIIERQQATDKTSSDIVKRYVQGYTSFRKVRVGSRHDILLRVASSLRSRGYEEEFISSAIHTINDEACEEPLDLREIKEIIEFALLIEPKRSPVPEETQGLLWALRTCYGSIPFRRPLSLSDKAILLSLVNQGMILGEKAEDGIKVPIARRVLAEKAELGDSTVKRRIKVLTKLGFIRVGKDSRKKTDSGYIVIKTLVADVETGEVIFDAEDMLTKWSQYKDKRVAEGKEDTNLPSYGVKMLTAPSDWS